MSSGGHRGYVASRSVQGSVTPQNVQNPVIRDYAGRSGLDYRLSAAEYGMPGCYIMLNGLLDELERPPGLDGIICYSLFMLPARRARRRRVYDRLLAAGASLHAALEGLVLAGPDDIDRCEDLLRLDRAAASLAEVPTWSI